MDKFSKANKRSTAVLVCLVVVILTIGGFFGSRKYEETKFKNAFGIEVSLPLTDEDRAVIQPAVTSTIKELQRQLVDARATAAKCDSRPADQQRECTQDAYDAQRQIQKDLDSAVNLALKYKFETPDFPIDASSNP